MHDATNKRQTTQKKEKEEEKESGTDTECCGESSKQKARERNANTDLVQNRGEATREWSTNWCRAQTGAMEEM